MSYHPTQGRVALLLGLVVALLLLCATAAVRASEPPKPRYSYKEARRTERRYNRVVRS